MGRCSQCRYDATPNRFDAVAWLSLFLSSGRISYVYSMLMLSLPCSPFLLRSYETQRSRHWPGVVGMMSTAERRPVVSYSRRAREGYQDPSGRKRRALGSEGSGVAEESDQVITPISHMDLTLFVPDASSSTNRWSTYSAPDELMTPTPNDPYLHLCTRDPAHRSTTTMRRMHSTTAVPDRNTFASDEDFMLFAFATTGLGSEPPFAPTPSSPHISSLRASIPHSRVSVPCRQLPSPLEAVSPMTPAAHPLSSLRDIPHASAPHYSGAPPTSQPFLDQRASQIAANYSSSCDVSPLEDDVDFVAYNVRPPPGYEESQGQIQSDRRLEAARRAQDLQQRWRLSGSRRGG
ncbi:hypothetical protein BDY17DRAFT_123863 [Neohortaea acidophila]|uniref:Uncharacterized protein n=1 Tax=Neohortaea acidophila TaxID=245834 RepID=A0A6A6PWY5_9PEZI|nr:uncharacterized protein BDY17DRAFT_123863 [Neohortaea acidophila]KAF2484209.1 hypothetical protein BDY17DRAFT_123863 [Neohortaea acidophila]